MWKKVEKILTVLYTCFFVLWSLGLCYALSVYWVLPESEGTWNSTVLFLILSVYSIVLGASGLIGLVWAIPIPQRTLSVLTKCLLTVAVLLPILFALGGAEQDFRRYVQRTAAMKTYEQFVQTQVPCRSQYVFEHSDGKLYLAWLGRRSPITGYMASGAPCYIFDDTGTVVDFVPELGEGRSLDYRWNQNKRPFDGIWPPLAVDRQRALKKTAGK